MPSIENSPEQVAAEFTLTADDLYGYYYASIPRANLSLTSKILRGVFFAVLIGAFLYLCEWYPIRILLEGRWSSMSDPWIVYDSLIPVAFIGFGLIGTLIMIVTRRVNANRSVAGQSIEGLKRIFKASTLGFEFGGSDTYGKFRWSEVMGISDDHRVIAFDCLSNRVFGYRSRLKVVIPKRIFNSKDEAKLVLTNLRSFREHAVISPFTVGEPLLKPDSQLAGLPFEPDDSMVSQLQRARWSEGKGVWQAVGGAATFFFFFGAVAYFQFYTTHDYIQPLITFVGYGVVVPIISRSTRSLYRPKPGSRYAAAGTHMWRDIGPLFLAIGPDRFAISSTYGTVEYAWDLVEFIKVHKSNLVISFKKSQGIVIPGRTFSSESELNSFCALITAVWKRQPIDPSPSDEPISWPPPPNWRIKAQLPTDHQNLSG